jgi:hypothetical protein
MEEPRAGYAAPARVFATRVQGHGVAFALFRIENLFFLRRSEGPLGFAGPILPPAYLSALGIQPNTSNIRPQSGRRSKGQLHLNSKAR